MLLDCYITCQSRALLLHCYYKWWIVGDVIMPMDRLLEKLRVNMAELSIQGDDFTRQIWQMYATFEEFIDHHTAFGRGNCSVPPPAPAGGEGDIQVSSELNADSDINSVVQTSSEVKQGSVAIVSETTNDEVVTENKTTNRSDNMAVQASDALRSPYRNQSFSIPPRMMHSDLGLNSREQFDDEYEQFGFDLRTVTSSYPSRRMSLDDPSRATMMMLSPATGMQISADGEPMLSWPVSSSHDDMSLLLHKSTRGSRHRRSHSSRRRRSPRSENPILDTIGTIQTIVGESDDYNTELLNPNIGATSLQVSHTYHPKVNPSSGWSNANLPDDSIGYAGSNSIDSGYKSSCPTPDLSDGIYYAGADISRKTSIASVGSNSGVMFGSSASFKPRVSMGTKVFSGKHYHQQQYGRGSSSQRLNMSRSSDPGCYDSTLEHLLHLRQSILSAMRRYDSTMDSTTAVPSSLNLSPADLRSPMGQAPSSSEFIQSGYISPRNRSPTSRNFPSSSFMYPRPRSRSPMDHGFRPRSASASSAARGSEQQSEASTPHHHHRALFASRNTSPLRSSYPNSRTHSPASYSSASTGSGKSSPSCYSTKPHQLHSHRFNMAAPPRKSFVSKSPMSKTDSSPDEKGMSGEDFFHHHGAVSDPSTRGPPPDVLIPAAIGLRRDGNSAFVPLSTSAPEATTQSGSNLMARVEDKYRKSSVARVKRLRDTARGGESPSSSSDSSTDFSPVHHCPPRLRHFRHDSHSTSSSNQKPPKPPRQNIPGGEHQQLPGAAPPPHFNEMAQCMLDIIDNLQNASISDITPGEENQTVSTTPTSKSETTKKKSQPLNLPLLPAENYHLYEEIMYGVTSPHHRDARGAPPPLPERPNGMFRKTKKERNQQYKQETKSPITTEFYGIGPEEKPILSPMTKASFSSKQEDDYGFKVTATEHAV